MGIAQAARACNRELNVEPAGFHFAVVSYWQSDGRHNCTLQTPNFLPKCGYPVQNPVNIEWLRTKTCNFEISDRCVESCTLHNVLPVSTLI